MSMPMMTQTLDDKDVDDGGIPGDDSGGDDMRILCCWCFSAVFDDDAAADEDGDSLWINPLMG